MPVDTLARRLGIFVKLAETVPGNLGRTSLMKLCYFLQTIRKVPLQYEFSLYSYGPFDSEVLSDLQAAENLDILQTDIEYYPGGYRYRIGPAEKSDRAKELAREFLDKYRKDVEWVAHLFGNRSASDLELLSTILFVYDEGEIDNHNDLADKVNSIKPHFPHSQISSQIEWLDKSGLLK